MAIQLFKQSTGRQFLAGLAFLLLSGTILAQNKAKIPVPAPANINLQVYRQAVAVGDNNMVITALHYLIAGDPVKYGSWQDTLALAYLQNNAYQQAYILSDILVKGAGYTDLRMEIKAISAKGLQQPVEAINAYAMLYDKTRNPAFGFEQLQLQYAIHRLTETIVTGNSLLLIISPSQKEQVTVLKADNKNVQKISLKAAVCNLMGLAYVDLKDKANATAQFEVALKESPDFEGAKTNLDVARAMDDNVKK